MPDNSTVATQTLKAEAGKPVTLPVGETAANAEFTRDGQDLCLSSDGHMIRIEGYFSQEPTPDVVSADGAAHFTPQLVNSFLPPQHASEYAEGPSNTATDATGAVGKITKVEGDATITHADGTKTTATMGAIVFQGDIITTGEKGAVNIVFADNTSFSISRNAKLAVDEFSYDPQEHSGTSFFSMLQGVFVYQSGDIGKDDPSKVNINTPVGSIGIRGTLVAGEINPPGQESKVTIVDGAVIITNGGGELVLNDAFETATLTGYDTTAANAGQLDSHTFSSTYASVAPVAVSTFSAVASGVYQQSPTTPAQGTNNGSNDDGSTQQTTQPAPGDDVKAQPDGGTVTPPATDGTMPAPDVKAAPADGTVAPPADSTIPAQDGMVMPVPGTQVLTGTDPALPPATAGSVFTDPKTGTFPPTSGSVFTGTTATPPATGGTTTGTNPPPATGASAGTGASVDTNTAPPAPMANFVFAPVYLNGTPNNQADDGVPIFGSGLNASTVNPVMIGQISLQNFSAAPIVTITGGGNYNAVTGDFSGNVLSYANLTAGDTAVNIGTGTVMSFDSAGHLMLTDPTGMLTNLNNNGTFSFHIRVEDTAGKVFLDNNYVVNVKQDSGGAGYVIQVGDHSNGTSLDINDPSQVPRLDTLFDTAGNDLLIAGDFTQADPLFGNVLRSSAGGNDVLIGGTGRDLMINDTTTGAVKMFGLGGDDTMKVLAPNVFASGASVFDGGDGADTLVLGPLGYIGGIIFDMTASANNVFNLERLLIEAGTTVANRVALDAQDVFEMTGANHVLRMGMAGAGLAQVDIGNTAGTALDFTFSSANVAQNTVTYTGVYNNSTVTLIIETNANLTVNQT